jgi:hypothetical protein
MAWSLWSDWLACCILRSSGISSSSKVCEHDQYFNLNLMRKGRASVITLFRIIIGLVICYSLVYGKSISIISYKWNNFSRALSNLLKFSLEKVTTYVWQMMFAIVPEILSCCMALFLALSLNHQR